jgi:hypothetical protein
MSKVGKPSCVVHTGALDAPRAIAADAVSTAHFRRNDTSGSARIVPIVRGPRARTATTAVGIRASPRPPDLCNTFRPLLAARLPTRES